MQHTHITRRNGKKTEGGKITEIVATNVVASQLPEQQPTATLNACAKIQDDKQYLQLAKRNLQSLIFNML